MIPVWRRNYQRYRSYFSHIVSQYKDRGDLMSYLEIMLSLATISVFALFALRPTLVTIAQLIRQIEVNTQTIETMDKKIDDVTKAQIINDRERSKIMMLRESIPTGASPETIVRQIEGLSNKHNVSVSSVNIGKAPIVGQILQQIDSKENQTSLPKGTTSDISYVEATITVSAPLTEYQSMQNFLSDIEKQRLPITITQMSTSSVKNRESRLLSLVMKLYLPFSENKSILK